MGGTAVVGVGSGVADRRTIIGVDVSIGPTCGVAVGGGAEVARGPAVANGWALELRTVGVGDCRDFGAAASVAVALGSASNAPGSSSPEQAAETMAINATSPYAQRLAPIKAKCHIIPSLPPPPAPAIVFSVN